MKLKKSLGQHFLSSPAILKKIAAAGEVTSGESVLEIGPGEGALTEELLRRGAYVVAVEKDDRLIPFLQKKFSNEISQGQLILIHDDILDLDSEKLQAVIRRADRAGYSREARYKIIANIPYYITGAVIRKFLDNDYPPERMVLLVQKEVAERIIARNGKESILSISIKAYGQARIIGTVPRTAFSPAPRVDSAIMAIENISKKFFDTVSENRFFETVKKGFGSKRKLLSNNLPFLKNKGRETFGSLGISRQARAEDLTLEEWKKLAEFAESVAA